MNSKHEAFSAAHAFRIAALVLCLIGGALAGCTAPKSTVPIFPAHPADVEEMRREALMGAYTTAFTDGTHELILVRSEPFGGGRVLIFYAIYAPDASGVRLHAQGRLDDCNDARASISGDRIVVEGYSPGPNAHWEVRDTVPLPKTKRKSRNEAGKAQPGATDNPDDAQRLREDH